MAVLSFPTRALMLLAVLATTVVMAHPADVDSSSIDPCSTVRCTSETTCKVIDGKAQCVPIHGVTCGKTVCAAGLYCCNASCGMCVKPGMMCTQHVCDPSLPVSSASSVVVVTPSPTPSSSVGPQCGPNVCKAGQECCNASCGICVEPGKGCTKQFCGQQCGKTLCAAGMVCCNASCGICAPPDGACTAQFCESS